MWVEPDWYIGLTQTNCYRRIRCLIIWFYLLNNAGVGIGAKKRSGWCEFIKSQQHMYFMISKQVSPFFFQLEVVFSHSGTNFNKILFMSTWIVATRAKLIPLSFQGRDWCHIILYFTCCQQTNRTNKKYIPLMEEWVISDSGQCATELHCCWKTMKTHYCGAGWLVLLITMLSHCG